MNDDIKEYLDYFKKYATISEKAILEDIEDYITNLQEYYNDNTNKYEELLVKYSDLQENNQAMQEEMARTWKIADDYKSRIDKAIEYIGNPFNNYWNEESKYLLDILQGEDKE